MPDQEESVGAASPTKKKHRGRLIGAIIVVVLIIIIVASNSGSSSKTSASSATTKAPGTTKTAANTGNTNAKAPTAVAPAAKPTTTTSVKSWYDSKYGSFAPITVSGTSDSVIKLPPGAKAGIITAKYSGSDDFIITGLDSNNHQTSDLPVDTMGSYSGVTAFGFTELGNSPTQLKVSATGPWTITVSPVSSASATVPKSGTGDDVFLYNGHAANWTLNFKGSGDFIVSQFSSSLFPNLAVDEMGSYSGTVPMDAGPSVVQFEADGSWTIS